MSMSSLFGNATQIPTDNNPPTETTGGANTNVVRNVTSPSPTSTSSRPPKASRRKEDLERSPRPLSAPTTIPTPSDRPTTTPATNNTRNNTVHSNTMRENTVIPNPDYNPYIHRRQTPGPNATNNPVFRQRQSTPIIHNSFDDSNLTNPYHMFRCMKQSQC